MNNITDQEVLNWLAAHSMLAQAAGVKNATVTAWICDKACVFDNPANGAFLVTGTSAKGRTSSAACNSVDEAVANWKAFFHKRPEVEAQEIRAQAKELLKKARALETGVAA